MSLRPQQIFGAAGILAVAGGMAGLALSPTLLKSLLARSFQNPGPVVLVALTLVILSVAISLHRKGSPPPEARRP